MCLITTNINLWSLGGEALPGQEIPAKHSVYPRGIGPEAPAWVAFDRQVLCFDAYFQEAVHEKQEERYRVRKYVQHFIKSYFLSIGFK